jgi:hypothetical protein
MLHTIKTQLVELLVQGVASTGNNNTRFYFNDQPFLRSKNIVSLETYFAEDSQGIGESGGMLAPSNTLAVAAAVGTSAYLTLYGNDPETPPVNPTSGQTKAPGGVVAQGEWIQQFPLVSLHRINNGNSAFVFAKETFIQRIIIWEKSYITIPVAGAFTDNFSFLFNVGYTGIDTPVS